MLLIMLGEVANADPIGVAHPPFSVDCIRFIRLGSLKFKSMFLLPARCEPIAAAFLGKKEDCKVPEKCCLAASWKSKL